MSGPATTTLEYAAPHSGRRIWLDTLGWAAYLGCSWTWCIGMFLPVLLIRDYGVSAWWAFTIPNIIGAAAMGWVVRSREHSAAMIAAHLPAIRVFSLVTVAFMTFFAMWVIGWPPIRYHSARLLLVCLVAVLGLAWIGPRHDRSASAGAISLSVVLWLLGTALGVFPDIAKYSGRGNIPQIGLLPLSAVMVFGFLLCPYLDQTFHRARQSADGERPRLAFALGFGVFFAAMIVFTLCYSAWPVPFLSRGSMEYVVTPAYELLAVHILTQSVVTIAMHLRQPIGAVAKLGCRGALSGLALLAGFLIAVFTRREFETTYRFFMSAYGLVFPAYVLICMKPWRQAASRPTARQWSLFSAAVVVAAPMYWLAFIDGQMMWLLPALACVGVMWLFTAGKKGPAIS